MSGSFVVRNIRATFTLSGSNAVFPGTTANQLQLSGLRMSAVIKGAGIPAFPEASLRVYGMMQQDMNALAVVQVLVGKPQYTRNIVEIEADSGDGFVAVFTGQIIQAGPDYSSLPDVCLYVQAVSLGLDQLAPAVPVSYPGVANVATIVSSIASAMGIAFENDGVTSTLTNAHYSGPYADQLRTVCKDAGIYYAIEPGTPNLLVISPAAVPRQNLTTFVLTPGSGLVGYPEVLGNGYINVRSLFNPSYRMNGPLQIQGSDVVIDSSLPTTLNSQADGNWIIGPLTHTIESQKPGGAWFTELRLGPPGSPVAQVS